MLFKSRVTSFPGPLTFTSGEPSRYQIGKKPWERYITTQQTFHDLIRILILGTLLAEKKSGLTKKSGKN